MCRTLFLLLTFFFCLLRSAQSYEKPPTRQGFDAKSQRESMAQFSYSNSSIGANNTNIIQNPFPQKGNPIFSCNSTIFFAYGRSATGTVGDSLIKSTPLQYCREKETFSKSAPSTARLRFCFVSHKATGGVFVHVKPWHIQGPRLKRGGDLKDEANFFKSAYRVGFRRVITTWRENVLAALVSSYEMGAHSGSTRFRVPKDFVALIEQNVDVYNKIWAGAVKAGFQPFFFRYTDVIEHQCLTLAKIAKAMGCSRHAYHCKQATVHTSTSNHKSPLGVRVGKAAETKLRAMLEGTPFAWMLNLEENYWPSKTIRPEWATPYPLRKTKPGAEGFTWEAAMTNYEDVSGHGGDAKKKKATGSDAGH